LISLKEIILAQGGVQFASPSGNYKLWMDIHYLYFTHSFRGRVNDAGVLLWKFFWHMKVPRRKALLSLGLGILAFFAALRFTNVIAIPAIGPNRKMVFILFCRS
jgi:hypothetical protein